MKFLSVCSRLGRLAVRRAAMSIEVLVVGALALVLTARAVWMLLFRGACESEARDFLARKFGGSTRQYADDARRYWRAGSLIWAAMSAVMWALLIYLLRRGI